MSHHCESWQMLDHADGGWYCGACGKHEAPLAMTAAEKAMQDIEAALDVHFSNGSADAIGALHSIAQAVGRYKMERIGEGA